MCVCVCVCVWGGGGRLWGGGVERKHTLPRAMTFLALKNNNNDIPRDKLQSIVDIRV